MALCSPVKENVFIGVAQAAGLFGNAYDPYTMYDDSTGPPRDAEFILPPDMTLGRLQARLDLRAAARTGDDLGPRDFDTFYGRAFSLIESARAARAFRLDEETAGDPSRVWADAVRPELPAGPASRRVRSSVRPGHLARSLG